MDIPLCWLILLCLNWAFAQMLYDIINLDLLFETENSILETYQRFINLQQIQLSLLKQQLAHHIHEHEIAKRDSEYSSNPIHAFLLIRRLTRVKQILTIMQMQDNYENIKTRLITLQETEYFPVDEDLKTAANILLHLQETYNLDAQSISRGELNGIRNSIELSVDDCFAIGKQSFSAANYDITISWMNEALRKYNRWPWDTRTLKWEIIEYMAKSAYNLGRFSEAASLVEELLSIFPEYQGVIKNLPLDNGMMDETLFTDDEQESLLRPKIKPNQSVGQATWEQYERHKSLCRKEINCPIEIQSQLKCRYAYKNNPYLLIGPLKEEEAYLSPRILLYRDAIYDTEIEVLHELATPKLERSKVGNRKFGWYRSSKSTSFAYEEHPTLLTIKRRVQTMTLLNGESFEKGQITNYGIGGFYVPHFDFFQMGTSRNDHHPPFGEDRIATVLFYTSDVKMGGATVFPTIDVSVWPERGTAVFWENLHSSGVADRDTLHAACPVLLGSKWVTTIWVRERDQIFSRPCDPNDTTWLSIS